MDFSTKLVPGKLIKRYKRFLADVELEDGSVATVHCNNSGSLKSCLKEGAPVYISPSCDPTRKTKFTWEMIYINNGWVGINTLIPNVLVFEAIRNGTISRLSNFKSFRREVRFGDSRFDIFAQNELEQCFIEVKNVTLKDGKYARFPDAVTVRGKKHLETLANVKNEGYRAVMLYLIQRTDVEIFGPAWEIDPVYSQALVEAVEKGVEIIPLMAHVTPESVEIKKEIHFDLLK